MFSFQVKSLWSWPIFPGTRSQLITEATSSIQKLAGSWLRLFFSLEILILRISWADLNLRGDDDQAIDLEILESLVSVNKICVNAFRFSKFKKWVPPNPSVHLHFSVSKWFSLCWVKPGWKGSNWWPIHVVESMLPTMLSHLILWFPRISGEPSLDSYIYIIIYNYYIYLYNYIYRKFPSKLEIERLWSVYPLWFQPSLAQWMHFLNKYGFLRG